MANTARNDSRASLEELEGKLNVHLNTLETVSSSNRTRIETLEIHQEDMEPVLVKNKENIKTKSVKSNNPPRNRNLDTEAGSAVTSDTSKTVSSGNGDKEFTKVDKRNSKNHTKPKPTSEQTASGNSHHRDRNSSRSMHSSSSNEQQQRKAQTRGGGKNHREETPTTLDRSSSDGRPRNTYKQHTVLLIHDENFESFDPKRFNSQFNVHCLKVDSYAKLLKATKRLNNTIDRLKPDCIYIHLGINDLLKSKSAPTGYVKELSEHLLTKTKAQICFSGLIPSSNDADLNKKIKIANVDTRDYISWLHEKKPNSKERIFTFTNDRISDQNTYSVNTGFKLGERGQKMLWIRLREGLKKTMRLPRTSYHSGDSKRRSTNRFSYG